MVGGGIRYYELLLAPPGSVGSRLYQNYLRYKEESGHSLSGVAEVIREFLTNRDDLITLYSIEEGGCGREEYCITASSSLKMVKILLMKRYEIQNSMV